jgi:HPr kinase/phosphorylase
MQTPLATTRFVHLLGEYLETKFAPAVSMHGSLVDIYGIGILLTGQSGIGKSEIALDLVERGHRLVADDMVIIKQTSEEILMGRGKEISEFLLELRGVGLVDIRRIFGIRGVRKRKRIEVEIKLVPWEEGKNYERVGLDEEFHEILGVKIPQVTLPINPGKNVTVIAETIAMHYLLKMYGYHTAKQFNERLKNFMKQKDLIPYHKDKSYFEKDWE